MKYTATYTSCTNTHVHYDLYLPLVLIRPKAIVQIHHGFGEHSGRYEQFAEYLSTEGFVVVVSDFPGHGSSLHDFEQGYFGSGNAIQTLASDMQRLQTIIRRKYENLPYFMLGNQLGSYVLRQYISKYGEFIDGAILMGTTGNDKVPTRLQKSLQLRTVLKGKMHRSNSYKKRQDMWLNSKFLPVKTKVDYLTSDPQERKRYLDDPMTDFVYTNQGYTDIMNFVNQMSNLEWIAKTPLHLAIYIISGKKDIFGNMGKGPKWVYDKFKEAGIKDIEMTIYEDCRHDILHERNRRKVYADILSWLNRHTYI